MNNLIILQARTGSKRFPGKVLMPLNGKPMIEWQIKRLQSARIAPIVLATTSDSSDDQLVKIVESLEIEVFRGSVNNVVQRFEEVIRKKEPDFFVRITGDCPLIMPKILVDMDTIYRDTPKDYFSNTLKTTFPDGLDAEFVSVNAFKRMLRMTLGDQEREHVTLALYRHPELFTLANYENKSDDGKLRWTVDYPEDLAFVRNVYEHFEGKELDFDFQDVMNLLGSGQVPENEISYKFRNIALQNEVSEK